MEQPLEQSREKKMSQEQHADVESAIGQVERAIGFMVQASGHGSTESAVSEKESLASAHTLLEFAVRRLREIEETL